MSTDIYILPEVVEDQVFTIWNDQLDLDAGIYWYEVDPWELWWLAENRNQFTNWKELPVKDFNKMISERQDLEEDTFVYLPLLDILKIASTWKSMKERPSFSKRLLIISEANSEISLQIKKSTNWKNISSSIRRLREVYDDWMKLQTQMIS